MSVNSSVYDGRSNTFYKYLMMSLCQMLRGALLLWTLLSIVLWCPSDVNGSPGNFRRCCCVVHPAAVWAVVEHERRWHSVVVRRFVTIGYTGGRVVFPVLYSAVHVLHVCARLSAVFGVIENCINNVYMDVVIVPVFFMTTVTAIV